MRIEIFLQHIFQERTVSESTIKDDHCGFHYAKNCPCNKVAMPFMDMRSYPIQRVFLREESFGGLLYDPTTGVIYRLDRDAFEVVRRLRQDAEVEILQKEPLSVAVHKLAKRFGVKKRDLRELMDELRIFGLW